MLSSKLKSYVVAGDIKRKALIKATKDAASRSSQQDDIRGDFKIDTILMGSTGIGKSHWTKKSLDEADVNYITIRGSVSFLTLCANLMLAHHHHINQRKFKEEKLVVFIDDCDTLFTSHDGNNAIKEMSEKFGPDRKISYNRIIQEALLEPQHLEILEEYKPKNGGSGFSVDCNDMIFIFATNFALPTENEANSYAKKNPATPRANRLQSLAAIRRRFTCRDFILDKATNWGWLAYVTLNDKSLIENILGKKDYESHKYEILNWVWNEWDQMTEHNLDTIKSLAYSVKEYGPDGYIDAWESEFLNGDLLNDSKV
jgi:hypothetical protein